MRWNWNTARGLLGAAILVGAGCAEEARAAFEASLERTPNRRNARAGLERADGSS